MICAHLHFGFFFQLQVLAYFSYLGLQVQRSRGDVRQLRGVVQTAWLPLQSLRVMFIVYIPTLTSCRKVENVFYLILSWFLFPFIKHISEHAIMLQVPGKVLSPASQQIVNAFLGTQSRGKICKWATKIAGTPSLPLKSRWPCTLLSIENCIFSEIWGDISISYIHTWFKIILPLCTFSIS
jgi:hypothetical protein